MSKLRTLIAAMIAIGVTFGLFVFMFKLISSGGGKNDELEAIAKFLAAISVDIPWHVTAFHPDYKMTAPPRTTAQRISSFCISSHVKT